ncbi:MAG: RrF2 family transcriptional regulator [Flavobacteriaceae bacterium]
MIFSKACTYGLRSLVFIANHSKEGEKVSIKQIAKSTDTPEPYVGKILQLFVKKNLLSSSKGPKGGFYLTEEQLKIPIFNVVEEIDGGDLMTKCSLGFQTCSDHRPCPVHTQFKKIRSEINAMLEGTTIENMSTSVLEGRAFLY